MNTFIKPSFSLFDLFMFLRITPSIAANIVFTKSVLIDRSNVGTIFPQHIKLVVHASKN